MSRVLLDAFLKGSAFTASEGVLLPLFTRASPFGTITLNGAVVSVSAGTVPVPDLRVVKVDGGADDDIESIGVGGDEFTINTGDGNDHLDHDGGNDTLLINSSATIPLFTEFVQVEPDGRMVMEIDLGSFVNPEAELHQGFSLVGAVGPDLIRILSSTRSRPAAGLPMTGSGRAILFFGSMNAFVNALGGDDGIAAAGLNPGNVDSPLEDGCDGDDTVGAHPGNHVLGGGPGRRSTRRTRQQ